MKGERAHAEDVDILSRAVGAHTETLSQVLNCLLLCCSQIFLVKVSKVSRVFGFFFFFFKKSPPKDLSLLLPLPPAGFHLRPVSEWCAWHFKLFDRRLITAADLVWKDGFKIMPVSHLVSRHPDSSSQWSENQTKDSIYSDFCSWVLRPDVRCLSCRDVWLRRQNISAIAPECHVSQNVLNRHVWLLQSGL